MLMKTENKIIWFRRKSFGWGWTPNTWQGWLIIVLYVAGLVGAVTAFDKPTDALALTISLGFLTFGLILLSYRYGESPRWQWRGEPIDKLKNKI